jgi:CMP-N-acetylneuraminic acid synthetase
MRVAIILARGGSKGILNKNLQKVGSFSLVATAVKTALEAECIDRVYVSSDSHRILDEGVRSGAYPIERPKDLSGDSATSESGLLHALEFIEDFEKCRVESIFFIQATSPFLKGQHINTAFAKYSQFELDSLFTGFSCHKFLWKDNGGDVRPVNHDGISRKRRQDLDMEIIENGALYIIRRDEFVRTHSRFCGKIGYSLMSEYSSLEIDTQEDLIFANKIAAYEGSN